MHIFKIAPVFVTFKRLLKTITNLYCTSKQNKLDVSCPFYFFLYILFIRLVLFITHNLQKYMKKNQKNFVRFFLQDQLFSVVFVVLLILNKDWRRSHDSRSCDHSLDFLMLTHKHTRSHTQREEEQTRWVQLNVPS